MACINPNDLGFKEVLAKVGNPILAEIEFEKQQGGAMLQLEETVTPKASPKTIAALKDFIKRIGVDVKTVDDIVVNGVKQDANAVALLTQKLIQVAEGLEAQALPEEAMHFAVEIIQQKDPKLFNRMLKEINDTQTYKDVLATYSTNPLYQTKDGKPNILKLKKEALGKALANSIISQNEERTEKSGVLAKIQQLWKDILQSIKNLIAGANIDQAALDILSGKSIGTAEDIRAEQGEAFLQATNPQDTIYNNIINIQSKIEKDPPGKPEGYYVDGKKVPRRVSDLVKDWYERRFRANDLTKSDYQKAVDDLKAEKGTAGHADLEYIQSIFVDGDGYLRDEPLDDSGYVSQLNPNNREMYDMLKTNLKERLESFPRGTRFMAEAMIYDAKRGLAGTVDFLAITPAGKVSILDWKFMDLNTNKYEDVPWYKVNAWNQQMEQYKLIIGDNYGVKPQNFEQTRMIPIKALYSEGNRKTGALPQLLSIQIGDVNVKNITEDYLVPVGLQNEKTGNKKIDALLEKLNAVYKKISETKVLPSEKLSKAEQLNALFSAIRQLQMKGNLKPLLYQAKILNKQIQSVIDTYNNKFEGQDAKSFSQKEINDFADALITAQNTLATYTNLDTELRHLFSGELSDEDKKLKEELRDTVDDARDLFSSLSDISNEFTNDIIGKSEGVDDLLSPEKIIKGITRLFASTATLQIKALEVLYKKANKAFGYASMDALDETKKLQDLKTEYDKLAQSRGFTVKNYFDIIKKKDKNELIDEFNPEFYSLLRKNIQDKDSQWVRDNVDVAEYNKFLIEKKKEEYERIDNKARIGTDEEIEAEIKKEKYRVDNLYDTSTVDSAGWYQYDLLKKFPIRDRWESKEWKELHKSENKAALDFYKYIKERNEYYQEIGYINKAEARTFLPYVRKGLIEKLIFGGKISLGEQFLRNISIDEGDVGYGTIDPLTGKPIDTVPIYFTKEIEGEISTDLFRTMALYNEMAIKFKYVMDIEAQARAILNTEKNKRAIATSVFGKTQYKDGKIEYTPDNNENTKLVENQIKAIIYGQRYIQSESFDQLLGNLGKFGETLNKKLGMKIFPEDLEGRQISINKVVTQLNNTFQLKTLGLNVLSATSNLFGGTAQSIINSGKYFTKFDYGKTELWLLTNKMNGVDKRKAIAALEYFLPLTENYNKEIAKTLSVSKLSQENIQDFLMILMRNSDMHVQTVNFFSYLNNSIVDNGQVINVREYLRSTPEYANIYSGTAEQRKNLEAKFEEDVAALIEQKGVMKLGEVKDGKFVIPGVERKSDSVIELRRKVQQISKDALGNLTEDDVRTINQTIYGKSFMMFKNWIPRLADVRFGNLKYNSASDAYEWGRMRMVTRMISEDVLGSLGNLKNSIMANDKGVEFMKTLYQKKKEDYEKETGKTLEMTEAEFIDLARKNIKGQALDAIFLLSLFALFMGLKANAPDDDEDPRVKNQYKFILRAADKLRDEIAYFYDPTSISGLVSSGIFPSMSLITNFEKLVKNFALENYYIATGQEDKAEKNFVIKYLLRTFPITSQAQGMLPMFYPDLAKDLGIKAQAQSGFIR
jgi:hypothetical protein